MPEGRLTHWPPPVRAVTAINMARAQRACAQARRRVAPPRAPRLRSIDRGPLDPPATGRVASPVHPPCRLAWRHRRHRWLAQRRCRPLVGPGPAKLEQHPAVNLNRPQISERVKVIPETAQGNTASLTAIDVRLTSRISANGIGAAEPFLTAEMKAAAQAFWPLSWRQRRLEPNPGQP